MHIGGLRDQRTTGITETGGHTVGGAHTNVGGGDHVLPDALTGSRSHDRHASPLQVGGHVLVTIGGLAPAGNNGVITSISGIATGNGGQSDGLDQIGVGGVRNANQGNIVQQIVGIVLTVLNDVVVATVDTVSDLTGGTDIGAQPDSDASGAVEVKT